MKTKGSLMKKFGALMLLLSLCLFIGCPAEETTTPPADDPGVDAPADTPADTPAEDPAEEPTEE